MNIQIVDFDDLPEAIRPQQPNKGPGRKWANYFRVDFGNGKVNYYSDAMESEDANFHRGLGWVRMALLAAYAAGVTEGASG